MLVCTMLYIMLVMWSCKLLGGKTLVSRLPHNCGFSVQRIGTLHARIWLLSVLLSMVPPDLLLFDVLLQVGRSNLLEHLGLAHNLIIRNDMSTYANSNRNWVQTSNRFLVA